jgi:hypothetical protein
MTALAFKANTGCSCGAITGYLRVIVDLEIELYRSRQGLRPSNKT